MEKKIRVKDRSDIEEEMRRLFSGFSQMRHRVLLHAINLWHPATDVYETELELRVVCELAGVTKQNISIHIEDSVMTISGVRLEPKTAEKAVFHNLEINYGPFERNIQLPQKFMGSEPKATFANGILTVKMPISPDNSTLKIDVEVG